MKQKLVDLAVALWALFVCLAFVVPNLLGEGSMELVQVARYVYTGVLAAGLVCVAARLVRMVGGLS